MGVQKRKIKLSGVQGGSKVQKSTVRGSTVCEYIQKRTVMLIVVWE